MFYFLVLYELYRLINEIVWTNICENDINNLLIVYYEYEAYASLLYFLDEIHS